MLDFIADIQPNTRIVGHIQESLVGASYVNFPASASPRVLRIDRTGAGAMVTDETTQAVDTGQTWRPFGASTIPAGSVLRVYDSRTAGAAWATNEITLESGSLADMGQIGWQQFVWGEANTAAGVPLRQAWNPSADPFSGLVSLPYILLELDAGAQATQRSIGRRSPVRRFFVTRPPARPQHSWLRLG